MSPHSNSEENSTMDNNAIPAPAASGALLNCIIDESALLAGLADNLEEGIKRWINAGAINIFVPLYTLDRLNKLRDNDSAIGIEASKALEWLDRITSWTESRVAGRVELQGPEDQYQTWQEVEKYLLPDTPLSYEEDDVEEEYLVRALDESLAIQDAPDKASRISHALGNGRSASSESALFADIPAHKAMKSTKSGMSQIAVFTTNGMSPKAPEATGRSRTPRQGSPSAGIPARVRPLLNFVVWRAHNDVEPGTARYILLTDDPVTQKQAQKFGVRAKLLNQLRNIVLKDGRKLDVGKPLPEKDDIEDASLLDAIKSIDDDVDDAEEILFKPVPRSVPVRNPTSTSPNILDPDHFGRSPSAGRRGNANGNGNGHINAPTRSAVGRVPLNSTRGRGNAATARQPRPPQFVKPIDPDSYVRPSPTLRRGRGGGRRLWEPT